MHDISLRHDSHDHPGLDPISIGKYKLWLGAGRCITDVSHVDAVVSLNGSQPKTSFGACYTMVDAELPDYGGVPACWEEFIRNIADEIKAGKKILGFCTGGHGRTGVFAASLVAVLRPSISDPIEYVRKAHCEHAVESNAQVIAIFALLGKPAPSKYLKVAPPINFRPVNSVKSQSAFVYRDVDDDYMQMFTAPYGGYPPRTEEDEFRAAINAVVVTGDNSLMNAYEKKLRERASLPITQLTQGKHT